MSLSNQRTKEILGLIIDELVFTNTYYRKHNSGYFHSGICSAIKSVVFNNLITHTESMFIKIFISKNIPTIENEYKEFADNKYWQYETRFMMRFWWTTIEEAPETEKIRIDYLNALINNIK